MMFMIHIPASFYFYSIFGISESLDILVFI